MLLHLYSLTLSLSCHNKWGGNFFSQLWLYVAFELSVSETCQRQKWPTIVIIKIRQTYSIDAFAVDATFKNIWYVVYCHIDVTFLFLNPDTILSVSQQLSQKKACNHIFMHYMATKFGPIAVKQSVQVLIRHIDITLTTCFPFSLLQCVCVCVFVSWWHIAYIWNSVNICSSRTYRKKLKKCHQLAFGVCVCMCLVFHVNEHSKNRAAPFINQFILSLDYLLFD